MEIDLTHLYELQADLDKEIAELHGISYATTRTRRLLALLVEIGELINSTRCHKFWSNKGSEPKERVLDEFSDGVHFFLSLGLDIKVSTFCVEYNESTEEINEQFLALYKLVLKFLEKQNEKTYLEAFGAFLALVYPLGLTMDELVDAYLKKMEVNHERQKTNY